MDLLTDEKFEKLYNEFRKPLLRYISYKVSDSHISEEILNDVFLKVSKSIDTLNEKEKIKSWLYRITSNTIIDYYRKNKDNFIEINDDILDTDEDDSETIFDDLNCCIDDFLNQLPKQYSESLKGVYLDEYTQKEYSEKHNLKLSTVKSQVKRGKESMKEFFEKCCEFEKDRLDNITHYTPKSECGCNKC